VFTGHAAIAVLGKRLQPTIPIGALLAASYGPDAIDIGIRLAGFAPRIAIGASHSLLMVAVAAAVAGAGYFLWRRSSAAALVVSAVYLSHWPADFLTGRHKPLLPDGPGGGLFLYGRPLLDFALEASLLVGVYLVARIFIRPHFVVILLILQLLFNVGVARDHSSLKLQMLDGLSHGDHLRERLMGTVRPRMALAPRRSRPTTERAMAEDRNTRGLFTLVCLTCGKEEFFDTDVPEALKCTRCSGTVFRTFATPTEPDEATIAQLEQEARSIQYGDASPGTTPDEVRDLDAM
jgi:hypothetical protein